MASLISSRVKIPTDHKNNKYISCIHLQWVCMNIRTYIASRTWSTRVNKAKRRRPSRDTSAAVLTESKRLSFLQEISWQPPLPPSSPYNVGNLAGRLSTGCFRLDLFARILAHVRCPPVCLLLTGTIPCPVPEVLHSNAALIVPHITIERTVLLFEIQQSRCNAYMCRESQ